MVRDDAATQIAQVQGAYDDFKRGDIASLLSRLDDGIVWETPGAGTAIPYAGRLQGKAAVAGFFESLGSTVDFQVFDTNEFIAGDDTVVTLGRYVSTVRATGIAVDEGFAMVFRLKNGKIADFREYSDARSLAAAFTAPPKK